MSAQSAPTDKLIGVVLAERYEVLERLGEGAMGSVYKARHVKVGRTFAVKVLHPRLLSDAKVALRFAREAALAGRLRHPNVVGVVDVGDIEGTHYMVMEYAEGPDLAHLLAEAPMPPARIIHLVRQILEGLYHAHEQGLIHRDLKPENVIVERDTHGAEMPRIVDFGIALLRDGGEGVDGEGRITTNGLVLGTPHYMAPEQAVADPIDHRIDLFALGIVLYEMLSGQLPFDGSGAEVARANLLLDAPAIAKRVPHLEVDPLLEAFARTLMAKKPSARPATAKAARELLDLIERDRPAAAKLLGVPLDISSRVPAITEPVPAQQSGPTVSPKGKPAALATPPVRSAQPMAQETRRLRATPSPSHAVPGVTPPIATPPPGAPPPVVPTVTAPTELPQFNLPPVPIVFSAARTPVPLAQQQQPTAIRTPLDWPVAVKHRPWLILGAGASIAVVIAAVSLAVSSHRPTAPAKPSATGSSVVVMAPVAPSPPAPTSDRQAVQAPPSTATEQPAAPTDSHASAPAAAPAQSPAAVAASSPPSPTRPLRDPRRTSKPGETKLVPSGHAVTAAASPSAGSAQAPAVTAPAPVAVAPAVPAPTEHTGSASRPTGATVAPELPTTGVEPGQFIELYRSTQQAIDTLPSGQQADLRARVAYYDPNRVMLGPQAVRDAATADLQQIMREVRARRSVSGTGR